MQTIKSGRVLNSAGKDEQQIDIEISCIKIFEVSGWEVLLLAHFIVAFFDLIRNIYVEK